MSSIAAEEIQSELNDLLDITKDVSYPTLPIADRLGLLTRIALLMQG